MGIDLSLLPYAWEGTGEPNFAHDVLDLPRRSVLFDAITAIEKEHGVKVESGFNSYLSGDDAYEDTHYGETLETPYGDRVKWITAKHLKVLALLDGPQGAFIRALDDNHRVALFWH